jgi:hypothetical protein
MSKDEPSDEAPTHRVPGVPRPVSSSLIVISPEDLSTPPPSENAPPSAVVNNAIHRGEGPIPLTTLVAIGCGVFVVLVGLTVLLLFR